MTTESLKARLRSYAVPLVWIAVLATLAIVFRAQLGAWFSGTERNGGESAGVVLKAGKVSVAASLKPDPPGAKGNALLLHLSDADGRGLAKADVQVTLSMPAMGSMPEMRSTGEVSERGGGDYRATFDLAMGGTWTASIVAATSAGTINADYTLTLGTSGLVAVGATGGEAQAGPSAHAFSDAAKAELVRALSAYEQVRAALANDSLAGATEPSRTLTAALRQAATAEPAMPAGLAALVGSGIEAADALAVAADLGAARASFALLSESLIALVASDPRLTADLHAFKCPMTDGYNKWLQTETTTSNPYQGLSMPTCGSKIDVEEAVSQPPAQVHAHDPDEIAHYTCPMDTWVKQATPGKCPVCSMPLIAVTKEEVRTGVMRIDHRRRQLIGLKTALVEQRAITKTISAVGRVTYDETRLADVTLKYDGWIEKLAVEETGARVRRGQLLFTVYSPELYSAQQEYLLALSQRDGARDDVARQRAEMLLRGAKRRLELWDITAGQLAQIAKRGEPLEDVPVLAPSSGYVVAKDVVQGAAVKRGQRLFRIAALDKVWVEAEVFEEDIRHVKVGQSAHVTLPHLPGASYDGKVAFVYPYLDDTTRTARVRVELANADMVLKPDMYATVGLEMDLGERLVVPEAAVIYSGPRRIVFLDMDDDQLRPKQIEVGLQSDGYFEVLSGLVVGDRVVTSGNFLLSSESRLKAATGLW